MGGYDRPGKRTLQAEETLVCERPSWMSWMRLFGSETCAACHKEQAETEKEF